VSPFAAYLRVYEPLAAFPESVRARWREYAAGGRSGPALDRAAGVAAEHRAGLAALLALPPRAVPPQPAEGAFVVRAGGVTYLCPWDLRLRCWQALAALRRELPDVVTDALVLPAVAQAAEREYDAWRRAHPGAVSHVLTSSWRVPLPWFLLFEPAERRLVLGRRHPRAAAAAEGRTTAAELTRTLVYLTAMARARRRLARGLAVVRRAVADGPLRDEVTELGSWLEEFHPHALVELDYGGLVHLLDDDELRADASVAEVAEAVGALDRGDPDRALAAYRAVSARWQCVTALEGRN
jgi:hypothetical protein